MLGGAIALAVALGAVSAPVASARHDPARRRGQRNRHRHLPEQPVQDDRLRDRTEPNPFPASVTIQVAAGTYTEDSCTGVGRQRADDHGRRQRHERREQHGDRRHPTSTATIAGERHRCRSTTSGSSIRRPTSIRRSPPVPTDAGAQRRRDRRQKGTEDGDLGRRRHDDPAARSRSRTRLTAPTRSTQARAVTMDDTPIAVGGTGQRDHDQRDRDRSAT